MAEYIEREALLEEVSSLTITITGMRAGKSVLSEALTAYRKAVLSEIKDAPAADVVEVVRCQNCKHAVWDEEEQLWKCVISADWNEDIGEYVGFVEYHDADDFCSYGKRKENNVQET